VVLESCRGLSAARRAVTAADSEQRLAAKAERTVRVRAVVAGRTPWSSAPAAERCSRWLAMLADWSVQASAAAAVPRGFDLGQAAVHARQTMDTPSRWALYRRADREELRRQGTGWSLPSDGKSDDDDDDDAEEKESGAGQKHQSQIR
jgi:hypothetical protein